MQRLTTSQNNDMLSSTRRRALWRLREAAELSSNRGRKFSLCGSPRQRRRNAGGFGACTPFGVKQQQNTRASCLCKQSFRICSARRMVQPSRQRCVDRLSGAGAKARGTLEALRCASLSACKTSTTPGHRVCANAASAPALNSQ